MDFPHDNSHRTWVRIASDYSELVPAYVLDYEPEKTAEDEGYYADEARQLFPLNSAPDVWLSAAYLAKNAGKLDYAPAYAELVESRVKDAAEIFGVSEDVDKIVNAIRAAGTEKQAEDEDDNYGWVERSADGTVISRRYPMFDGRGVKLAAEYFVDNRRQYPHAMRQTIARNIMGKAAEHGVRNQDLPGPVLREAGYGVPRRDILMSEMLERAKLVRGGEKAAALANINRVISMMQPAEMTEHMDKLAEILEAFDKEAELTHEYDRKLLMPADFLYPVTMDMAKDAAEDCVVLGQHVFSLHKLAELQPTAFSDVLGEEFERGIVNDEGEIVRDKLGKALCALSAPDCAALEEHLRKSFA